MREGREAKDLETAQQRLLKSLRELGKSGDLTQIVAVEKTLVRAERAYT